MCFDFRNYDINYKDNKLNIKKERYKMNNNIYLDVSPPIKLI